MKKFLCIYMVFLLLCIFQIFSTPFSSVKADEKFLRITDINSERKWVDCALNDLVKNREIKLPSFAASAL